MDGSVYRTLPYLSSSERFNTRLPTNVIYGYKNSTKEPRGSQSGSKTEDNTGKGTFSPFPVNTTIYHGGSSLRKDSQLNQ